jgi:hypothetical protein
LSDIDAPRGTYRPCAVCEAPIVAPFPAEWDLDMIKEGPPDGSARTFYTPHRPGCTAPYADPQPGISVRVRGAYVRSLTFLPAPTGNGQLWRDHGQMTPEQFRADARAVARREAERVYEPLDLTGYADLGDGWREIGYTDAGQMFTADGESVPLSDPPDLSGVSLGGGVLFTGGTAEVIYEVSEDDE